MIIIPAGTWAFLHESTIYEYLMYRGDEKTLWLKRVIGEGRVLLKKPSIKVEFIERITNTRFPDIKGIKLKGDISERPAEVKFVTSTFDYHQKPRYHEHFKKFISNNGCIVVLRHDHLPDKLVKEFPRLDVFEIDETDYTTFIRENLTRFLNRQMRSHNHRRIWLFQQSANFWSSNGEVPPACVSGRWCPSDNLTSFDLAPGDIVVFIRHSGRSYQAVAKHWGETGVVIDSWALQDLYVGRVTTPITSRSEYCQRYNYPEDEPLWNDETEAAKHDPRVRYRASKWPKVFEFEKIIYLRDLGLDLSQLWSVLPDFVTGVREIYATHVSRPIATDVYISLMEFLAQYENSNRGM